MISVGSTPLHVAAQPVHAAGGAQPRDIPDRLETAARITSAPVQEEGRQSSGTRHPSVPWAL